MKQYSFDYSEVKQAFERINPYLKATPLEPSFYLGGDNRKYYFKLESFQPVKSFKVRGALNKMLTLTEEERRKGVCTISSGNHGSSVSYAASLLGIEKAEVIVPETAPKSKVERIEYFGGRVLQMGDNYDEAHAQGMKYIEESGMTYIDAYYDDVKIYGGQGTIAIEILEQNPDIDAIVVPIGGGGLSTGIAVAAKTIRPDIRIIGVQTEACPAMIRSYEDGVCYEEYPIGETICDAVVGGVGALSYALLKDHCDDMIEIREESAARAVSFMAKQEKYIVEPSSALTVAAVMDHGDRIGGTNIALVLSGGNIDGEFLTELMVRY